MPCWLIWNTSKHSHKLLSACFFFFFSCRKQWLSPSSLSRRLWWSFLPTFPKVRRSLSSLKPSRRTSTLPQSEYLEPRSRNHKLLWSTRIPSCHMSCEMPNIALWWVVNTACACVAQQLGPLHLRWPVLIHGLSCVRDDWLILAERHCVLLIMI